MEIGALAGEDLVFDLVDELIGTPDLQHRSITRPMAHLHVESAPVSRAARAFDSRGERPLDSTRFAPDRGVPKASRIWT